MESFIPIMSNRRENDASNNIPRAADESFRASVVFIEFIDNLSSVAIEIITQMILGLTLIIQTMAVFLSIHKSFQFIYSNFITGSNDIKYINGNTLARNLMNKFYVDLTLSLISLPKSDYKPINNRFYYISSFLQMQLEITNSYLTSLNQDYNKSYLYLKAFGIYGLFGLYHAYLFLFQMGLPSNSIIYFALMNRYNIDMLIISLKYYLHLFDFNKAVLLFIDIMRCCLWTYVTYAIACVYYYPNKALLLLLFSNPTSAIPVLMTVLYYFMVFCKDLLYLTYLIHHFTLLLYYNIKMKLLFTHISHHKLRVLHLENEKCSICLGNHTTNSIKLPCNHVVHYNCAYDMITKHNNKKCPVCRHSFEHNLPLYPFNTNDNLFQITSFTPSYNLAIYNPFISNPHSNNTTNTTTDFYPFTNRGNNINRDIFERQPTILPILSLGLNQLSTHIGLNGPDRNTSTTTEQPNRYVTLGRGRLRFTGPTTLSIAPPLGRPRVFNSVRSYQITALTSQRSRSHGLRTEIAPAVTSQPVIVPIVSVSTQPNANPPESTSTNVRTNLNDPSIPSSNEQTNPHVRHMNIGITRDPSNNISSDNNGLDVISDEIIANLLYHLVTENDHRISERSTSSNNSSSSIVQPNEVPLPTSSESLEEPTMQRSSLDRTVAMDNDENQIISSQFPLSIQPETSSIVSTLSSRSSPNDSNSLNSVHESNDAGNNNEHAPPHIRKRRRRHSEFSGSGDQIENNSNSTGTQRKSRRLRK